MTYTRENVGSERLFVFTQSCFRTIDGKPRRWSSAFTTPFGILECRIDKIECDDFRAALTEMGKWKPAVALPMYANKKVLSFLNDYFCKKASRPKFSL